MASSLRTNLPARGYQLLFLGFDDSIIAALKREAEARTYKSVFETVGGKDDDKFRAQSRVTSSGAVAELRRALLESSRCIQSAWTHRAFSYLRSLPSGKEQEPHQNYPPKVLEAQGRKQCVPVSMIFAFQENTKVRVFEGCFDTRDDSKARLIDITVGFCIIFRGDLLHNGVAYDAPHYRIHCYLAFSGMRWTADVVSSVLPTFDCTYCGLRMLDSDKMRKHRTHCVKNPRSGENKEKRKRENEPLPTGMLVCCVCGRGYNIPSSYRTHISHPHKKLQQ